MKKVSECGKRRGDVAAKAVFAASAVFSVFAVFAIVFYILYARVPALSERSECSISFSVRFGLLPKIFWMCQSVSAYCR